MGAHIIFPQTPPIIKNEIIVEVVPGIGVGTPWRVTGGFREIKYNIQYFISAVIDPKAEKYYLDLKGK